MLLNLLFSTVFVLLLGLLCWFFHARLHLPVKTGEDTELTFSLTASGEAPELERVLRDLLWLQENDMLPGELRLYDKGLSEEAAELAKRLTRDHALFYYTREGESTPWMRSER